MFRETCRIINCNLVVKFPLAVGRSKYTGEGKRHTKQEMLRLARLKKFRFMHQFLPKVYYHDPKSGTLVMSYHPPFGNREDQTDAMGHMVQVLIQRATGVRTTDMHSENIHQKQPRRKRAVVIDLGY